MYVSTKYALDMAGGMDYRVKFSLFIVPLNMNEFKSVQF